MKIDKRYLKLPVSHQAQNCRLMLMQGYTVMMDYTVQLDAENPTAYYYPDLRNFVGLDLEFVWEPACHYIPELTDHIPEVGDEPLRPAAHFSATRGWINDPNGLILHNGVYHLFFQHNPAGPNWGNMHWGHAVSRDLLHWEEQETALFPDRLGTMFSGSAICDHDNRTGLKENGQDVLLFYYTACPAGMKLSADSKTSQCMAYSTDGGMTLRKYAGNPVIPHISGDNRDPKVVWAEELGCYVLALFLDGSVGNDFALFRSDDLLHWDKMQEILFEGDAECPDLYPLTSDKGSRYWVFSAASDHYIIGRMQDGKFVPVQAAKQLHYGTKSYAAQTFFGIPGGRCIRMAWNRFPAPGAVFNGSMCTPTEMTLKECANGIYLCTNPIREFASLRGNTVQPDLALPLTQKLTGKAQDITLELALDENSILQIRVLGLSMEVNADLGCIRVKGCEIPLFAQNGKAKLRIITDTTSTEIYIGDGEAFGVVDHLADYKQNHIALDIRQGGVTVTGFAVSELQDIH